MYAKGWRIPTLNTALQIERACGKHQFDFKALSDDSFLALAVVRCHDLLVISTVYSYAFYLVPLTQQSPDNTNLRNGYNSLPQ
jgi:hypothetical protein